MKKLFALALALLLVCSLAACGKDANKDESSSAPTSDAIQAGAVILEAPEAVFEEGTKVSAETVTTGKIYERAKTAVAPISQKFTVYEFNAVKNEAKVQPNGKLTVTFRIPDGYSNTVKVLYVADDGAIEDLAATVNPSERTVVAELSHFSTYVLVDMTDAPASRTSAAPSTTTTEKPTTTTTTKASYSAFQSHDWQCRVIVEDGSKFCHTYTLVLTDGDPRCSDSTASPYEEMVPPEYRDQEKPDYEFGGIQWYVGAGGAIPFSTIVEKDNTITCTDEDGNKLVLQRTSELTVKVVSNTMENHVKAGDEFTVVK